MIEVFNETIEANARTNLFQILFDPNQQKVKKNK